MDLRIGSFSPSKYKKESYRSVGAWWEATRPSLPGEDRPDPNIHGRRGSNTDYLSEQHPGQPQRVLQKRTCSAASQPVFGHNPKDEPPRMCTRNWPLGYGVVKVHGTDDRDRHYNMAFRNNSKQTNRPVPAGQVWQARRCYVELVEGPPVGRFYK